MAKKLVKPNLDEYSNDRLFKLLEKIVSKEKLEVYKKRDKKVKEHINRNGRFK